MLARAVGDANFELIKLLVEYAADPRSAHFTCVCRTGHPFIIKFFVDHGIDAETDQPFARALCYPKQRYLGVYMRYRKKFPTFKRQLNLALRHLARQGTLASATDQMFECLPSLQHDPNQPEDVLKVDADEDGVGGDDPAGCAQIFGGNEGEGRYPEEAERSLTLCSDFLSDWVRGVR